MMTRMLSSTPSRMSPVLSTCSRQAPKNVPMTEPLPPEKLVPPMMTAAMASSS